jgi:DNA-directed RNA polymerase omega subunit
VKGGPCGPLTTGTEGRKDAMQPPPKDNRYEFVVIAGKRTRQLLAGAVPRETGEKKTTIAHREVMRLKIQKVEETE